MKVIFLRVEVPDEWLNDSGGVDPCDRVNGVLFGDTTEVEALAQPDNTSKLYEELRSIIDGGSESFTHKGAVQYLKDSLRQEEWTPEDTAHRPGGLSLTDWEAVAADQAMTIAMMLCEQDPVAWQLTFCDESGTAMREVFYSKQHLDYHVEHNTNQRHLTCSVTPLYTLPPQRNPMTDKAIMDIVDIQRAKVSFDTARVGYKVARAIELHHGIGPTR